MKRLFAKLRPFWKIGVVLAIFTAISIILQVVVLGNPERTAQWLAKFGIWVIPFYVVFQTVGIVFPPAPGGIFALILIAILGPFKAYPIIYLTTTPLYVVNFLLARRYGRPFVMRMVGKQGLGKMDDYANDAGLGGLVMLKLLQGSYFDFVSYGLGLTSIPFWQFFWVNLLVEIPRDIVFYFIFKTGPSFFVSALVVELIAGALTVAYISIRHWQHLRRKSKT